MLWGLQHPGYLKKKKRGKKRREKKGGKGKREKGKIEEEKKEVEGEARYRPREQYFDTFQQENCEKRE